MAHSGSGSALLLHDKKLTQQHQAISTRRRYHVVPGWYFKSGDLVWQLAVCHKPVTLMVLALPHNRIKHQWHCSTALWRPCHRWLPKSSRPDRQGRQYCTCYQCTVCPACELSQHHILPTTDQVSPACHLQEDALGTGSTIARRVVPLTAKGHTAGPTAAESKPCATHCLQYPL